MLPLAIVASFFMFANFLALIALVTIIVYGRGYLRTFSMGALVILGPLMWTILIIAGVSFTSITVFRFRGAMPSLEDDFGCRLTMLGLWTATFLAGLLAIGVRLILEKTKKIFNSGDER